MGNTPPLTIASDTNMASPETMLALHPCESVASKRPRGGARDAIVVQQLPKRWHKVPGCSTPGVTNPQNTAFYYEKTLIFTKSTNPDGCPLSAPFLLQGATKEVPKVSGGAPRERPGWPP